MKKQDLHVKNSREERLTRKNKLWIVGHMNNEEKRISGIKYKPFLAINK